MEEVEKLVSVLYSPKTPPELLKDAQKALQLAQKSVQGWELAQFLLSSNQPESQFLGAQTFFVKINEGSDLPSPENQHRDLLSWLHNLVSQNAPSFVVRKLLNAIIKVFLYREHWPNCPLEVVQTLRGHHALIFEFLRYLVDDSELPSTVLREKLVPNVSNILASLLNEVGIAYSEALKALESWTSSFSDLFTGSLPAVIELSVTLFNNEPRFSLSEDPEELALITLNVLSNLYTQNWRSWPITSRNQLLAALLQIIAIHRDTILADYATNDVYIAFIRLAIAVCQEDFDINTQLHPFVAKMAGVSISVVDDPLAFEILEFWTLYIEEVISTRLSSSSSHASEVISSVISGYWPRIKLSPGLNASDWDQFASFRKDFADLIELSYPIMGSQLFDQLTSVVVTSLSSPASPDWLSIESGLFCLNGLSDIIGDNYDKGKTEFQSVQRIFQSSLWDQLPQCKNYRVRQTAVTLIGCFVDFFQSDGGQAHLAVTLNYLFSCLTSEALETSASRSILKLCDACGTKLVDEIPAFLSIYSEIRSRLSRVPHVRTVAAITCVSRAIQDLSARAVTLHRLLELTTTATPLALPRNSLETEQTRLKCIVVIAKNFKREEPMQQSPAHVEQQLTEAKFWNENDTSLNIKQMLKELMHEAINISDVTSVETICDLMKAGFAEGTGPFYLGEAIVLQFVLSKVNKGPVLTLTPVFDLARFYLITRNVSIRQKSGQSFQPREFEVFVDAVLSKGGEAPSAAIDLLTQLVAAAATMDLPFVNLVPGVREALELAVTGLSSGDRFVLRSSVALWREFLSSPSQVARSSDLQSSLDPLIAEVLIQSLVTQMSGNASRSDLGPICEVVKPLMSKHTMVASQLLTHSIVAAPQNQAIANQEEKTRKDFVTQLGILKGSRKTSDIVQKFWLKCRGIPDNYTPIVLN